MPRKKKKSFRAVKAVKEIAREKMGMPPPTRRDPNRRKQSQAKHKPTLGKLLGENGT